MEKKTKNIYISKLCMYSLIIKFCWSLSSLIAIRCREIIFCTKNIMYIYGKSTPKSYT